MTTADNKKIILPNGAVSNGTIINNTVNGKLRVEVPVGIGYGENIGKARDVIMVAAKKCDFIIQEDGVKVFVAELGDSAVNLTVHTYSTQQDYWGAYFGVMEHVKIDLDEAGIQIPFPQRDVHTHNVN
ncbi:MAG: small conductance mechanosensitive channel [Limisphaerales bacterium]|jgi:small conductance mechanosensitive channel